jgi:tetratricopeptide (TPR) repeat protein
MLQIYLIKINSVLTEIRFRITCLTLFIVVFTFSFPTLPQSNNDLLRIQVQEHINEGKFGEAINLLDRYISANPQNAAGYNLRSLCYQNRKNYEMAVYDLRSAVKLDQKNKTYNENLDRVVKAWETILYNNLVGFKREIKINPEKPANYLEVGKCYKNLGKWIEAENWYDDYLKREEPSADELIRYTEILAKNNHLSKGEPLLKKYTERYPDDHRLWSRYGYFTMWLGKKQIALKAFKKALELRPYFKEALDGYDFVRGKGYIYTVNDTTVRFNFGLPVSTGKGEYPIDKYYKKLERNQSDHETRILLIEELIKSNRFAEAEEQINVLSKSEKYLKIAVELEKSHNYLKDKYYNKRIIILQEILRENPIDKNSVLGLADLYSGKKELDSALIILNNYLMIFPNNNEVLYKHALISSWAGNLTTAYKCTERLIQVNPENPDYQLLFGQLSTWLEKDPKLAQYYLEKVAAKDPLNYPALSTLTLLMVQTNELTHAEEYFSKLQELKPDNNEILKLQRMIETRKKVNKEAELYKLVEKAREYLFNKECEKAIEQFKIYLSDENANTEVRKELADAYLCKGDFQSAISIYDKMILERPDDYTNIKQRAKLYLWSEDYSRALDEFIKLSRMNSDDAEVKLLLGDSFAAVKDYKNAKQIYKELLDFSPSSYIINQRLIWIEGPSYRSGFPTYTMLTPDFNYYTDNFDFLYSTYGLRFDLGVTDFLTLGISGYAGVLGSESVINNISIFKGNIFTRFSDVVSATAALGSTFFPEDEDNLLAEISLKAERPKQYSFSANFYSMDAAQILYSPFLVDTRLRSNYFLLLGDYLIKTSWKFSGSYEFITVSDDNKANRLQLRFGKVFDKVVGVGYEYYYLDFRNQSNLYWSPGNFESHSIWVDWEVAGGSDVNANLGGRIGYIPSDNFILREFYGLANFLLADSFTLQGRLTFTTTAQSGKGYTSTSFSLSAFWNF